MPADDDGSLDGGAVHGDVPAYGDVPTELGALELGGELSLGSLDDNAVIPAGSYGRSDGLPASIGPAASRSAAKPPAASAAPIDRFAPPDAAAEELAVELAPDEVEHRARKRRSSPPVFAPEPPARRSAPVLPSLTEPPLRGSLPLLQSPATMLPSPKLGPSPHLPRPAADPGVGLVRWLRGSSRGRFAAGVLLAIALGFVPAAIVGALRERSAFHTIDARVVAAQSAATSQQSYDALDELRADQLEAKRGARRMIMLTSILLWAAASSGIAYVWFKRVPWDRLS